MDQTKLAKYENNGVIVEEEFEGELSSITSQILKEKEQESKALIESYKAKLSEDDPDKNVDTDVVKISRSKPIPVTVSPLKPLPKRRNASRD